MNVPVIIELFKYVTWYTVLFKYVYSAIRLFKHVYRSIQLFTHGPWLYLTYCLHVHLHNPTDDHSPITFLLSPHPTWQKVLEIPSRLLPSQWRGGSCRRRQGHSYPLQPCRRRLVPRRRRRLHDSTAHHGALQTKLDVRQRANARCLL